MTYRSLLLASFIGYRDVINDGSLLHAFLVGDGIERGFRGGRAGSKHHDSSAATPTASEDTSPEFLVSCPEIAIQRAVEDAVHCTVGKRQPGCTTFKEGCSIVINEDYERIRNPADREEYDS